MIYILWQLHERSQLFFRYLVMGCQRQATSCQRCQNLSHRPNLAALVLTTPAKIYLECGKLKVIVQTQKFYAIDKFNKY